MAEGAIPVLYVDAFEVTLSPWGAFLRFGARIPEKQGGQQSAVFQEEARLAMGLAHLKVMATILVRQIMQHEAKLHARVDVMDEVLQSVGVSPPEWAQFWGLAPREQPAMVSPGGALVLAPSDKPGAGP